MLGATFFIRSIGLVENVCMFLIYSKIKILYLIQCAQFTAYGFWATTQTYGERINTVRVCKSYKYVLILASYSYSNHTRMQIYNNGK